ncbi:MAG: AbrB/MazE/SpoVT family DNA-binding domain-containing protein [Candidatus Aminicenantes bacterium]|nr:AbrB/MazE/SpoVT family DNA-binding domain-containing protein [Candidatus Aminicenantes bacterium]
MSDKKVGRNKNSNEETLPCCAVESIISVDERGQMVIPKEIREAARLKPGDKMAVIMWRSASGSCCLTLIKTDDLKDIIREKLSPMIKDLI